MTAGDAGSAPHGSAWERRRYALWAPIYDWFVAPLRSARRRSIESLSLRPGERVLLVGAGTGEDLPFIPPGVFTVATDLMPAMLQRARPKARPGAHLVVMDGHRLALPGGAFDAVVLHLILAVIPDPALCVAEVARVLMPGGRITVLDKFIRDGTTPSIGRRLLNRLTRPIATDITRNLGDIIRSSGAAFVQVETTAALGGKFAIARFVISEGDDAARARLS